MTLKRKLRAAWASAKVGVLLAMLLGVAALLLCPPLERWSYDLPHVVRPEVKITEVALVYMDDATHAVLKQPYESAWDRSLHAQLIESLTKSGAKAVAFDDLFTDPGTNAAASDALAQAIRAHGRVVLGADLGSGDYFGLASELRVVPPHTRFLAATPHWGFVSLKPDSDDAIREHFHGSEDMPSLTWKMASLLGAETTRQPNSQRQKRWLNYYGPRGTLPGISFHKALDSSEQAVRELFRDRVVFVGSATQSGFSGKRRDQFHSPYSGRSEPLWPGVEFHATQFLNLVRNDWLRRLHPLTEIGLILFCGLVAGLGLTPLRPMKATLAALAAAALLAIAACVVMWQTHTWFAWLVIAGVQIPVALAYSVIRRAQHASEVPRHDMTTEFALDSGVRTMAVADHEMLRRIGSGSYGDVWLARSATGTFRAVKVVDRKSAQDPRFEREFAGLKKFEPISRAHDGLVDILHVGRNEAAGQLYYVMELADSCASELEDDPEGYIPTTLKTKFQSRETLDTDECARLSLALTSALAFLHEQGLMHRDIKPSNIIFVQGQPKLADIGLVAATDETRSFVGTEGYIPPEGPGTPAADVFSLGKVLRELIGEKNHGDEKMHQLRGIIEQACARNLAERFQTGPEMLGKLQLALGLAVEPGATSSGTRRSKNS